MPKDLDISREDVNDLVRILSKMDLNGGNGFREHVAVKAWNILRHYVQHLLETNQTPQGMDNGL